MIVTVYRPIASYTYPHSGEATFCPPLVLADDHALPFPHVTEPPSPISQTTSSTSAVKVTVMPASLFVADHAALFEFIDQELGSLPGVKRVTSSVVLRLYKVFGTRTTAINRGTDLGGKKKG